MNADTCQGSSSGDLKTLPNKSSWRCTSMPEAALQRAQCKTAVFGIQNSFAASDVASRWLHAFSGAGCCPCMTCDCQLDTAQSDKKKIYRSTGEVSIIRVVSMSIMHLPPTHAITPNVVFGRCRKPLTYLTESVRLSPAPPHLSAKARTIWHCEGQTTPEQDAMTPN